MIKVIKRSGKSFIVDTRTGRREEIIGDRVNIDSFKKGGSVNYQKPRNHSISQSIPISAAPPSTTGETLTVTTVTQPMSGSSYGIVKDDAQLAEEKRQQEMKADLDKLNQSRQQIEQKYFTTNTKIVAAPGAGQQTGIPTTTTESNVKWYQLRRTSQYKEDVARYNRGVEAYNAKFYPIDTAAILNNLEADRQIYVPKVDTTKISGMINEGITSKNYGEAEDVYYKSGIVQHEAQIKGTSSELFKNVPQANPNEYVINKVGQQAKSDIGKGRSVAYGKTAAEYGALTLVGAGAVQVVPAVLAKAPAAAKTAAQVGQIGLASMYGYSVKKRSEGIYKDVKAGNLGAAEQKGLPIIAEVGALGTVGAWSSATSGKPLTELKHSTLDAYYMRQLDKATLARQGSYQYLQTEGGGQKTLTGLTTTKGDIKFLRSDVDNAVIGPKLVKDSTTGRVGFTESLGKPNTLKSDSMGLLPTQQTKLANDVITGTSLGTGQSVKVTSDMVKTGQHPEWEGMTYLKTVSPQADSFTRARMLNVVEARPFSVSRAPGVQNKLVSDVQRIDKSMPGFSTTPKAAEAAKPMTEFPKVADVPASNVRPNFGAGASSQGSVTITSQEGSDLNSVMGPVKGGGIWGQQSSPSVVDVPVYYPPTRSLPSRGENIFFPVSGNLPPSREPILSPFTETGRDVGGGIKSDTFSGSTPRRKQDVEIVQETKPEVLQVTKTLPRIGSGQRDRQRQDKEQGNKVVTIPIITQIPKTDTLPELKETPFLIPVTTTTPNTIITTKRPQKTVNYTPFTPKRGAMVPGKKKSSGPQGYNVFTRRRGMWGQIGPSGLSKEHAMNLGAFRVGTTAAASFKIQPSNSTIKASFGGKGILGDFYQKDGIFIERRERRIKSSGEKQEITRKGLAVLKNRRKWAG